MLSPPPAILVMCCQGSAAWPEHRLDRKRYDESNFHRDSPACLSSSAFSQLCLFSSDSDWSWFIQLTQTNPPKNSKHKNYTNSSWFSQTWLWRKSFRINNKSFQTGVLVTKGFIIKRKGSDVITACVLVCVNSAIKCPFGSRSKQDPIYPSVETISLHWRTDLWKLKKNHECDAEHHKRNPTSFPWKLTCSH